MNWSTEAEWQEVRIQAAPDDEKARAALVHARVQTEDYDRAEKALADWQAKVPNAGPEIDRSRGEVAAARGQWPEAAEAWRRYLKSAPDHTVTWVNLAVACEKSRSWEEAVQAMNKAIELSPSAEWLVQRASYRIRLHDWAAAEADAREADRLDATNEASRKLLPIFDRAEQWKGPITRLDAAIAKDPENPQLRLNRAEWLIGIGLTDAGADDVDVAFKKDPKSLRARFWSGLLAWHRGDKQNVGDVFEMQLHQVDAAFARELRALEKASEPEQRAAFLLRKNQPLMALTEVREVNGSPSKALALLALGRLPEAGIEARRAAEIRSADGDAWAAVAQVEIANGSIEQALDALQRSLKLKKSPETVALFKETQSRLGRK